MMADISDLPAPPKTADISDLPTPKTVAPPPAPIPGVIPGAEGYYKAPPPTLMERAGEVGKAGAMGGVAGLFTPELARTLGTALYSTPQTARFAPFVMGMGQGGRVAPAVLGAIGGLAGETGGQVLEASGAPGYQAELARVAGGILAPAGVELAARSVAGAGGWALSHLVNKAAPGLGTGARALGQILEAQERGGGVNLTQAQREFIRQKLEAIRGGQASLQPQLEIYNVLRQAAERTVQDADAAASMLERQAQYALSQGEAAAAQFAQQAEQRFGRLQSQFEGAAQVMREQARLRAESITQRAAQQTPEMQRAAQAEADAIIQQGREQADRMLSQSKERMLRLQEVAGKLRSTGARRVEQARGAVGGVGEARTPTEVGTDIRQGFMKVINDLKATREANVEKYKPQAFGEALAKEKSGQFYQGTKAYQQAVGQINNELKSAETGLANVPSGEVRKQLTNVKELLSRGIRQETTDPVSGEPVVTYQKLSFQALENMRRMLRDRSFGLPAEGYDAIGQQQAGRLATAVENIQKEFSPGFEKYLTQYAQDSKPLNEFKNRLGKAVSNVAEFDFGQFVTDPASLGGQAFRTATTVDQVIKTLGPGEAERLARSFLADKMRGGAAKDVTAALDASRDWIDKFPALRDQLASVARQAGVAESTAQRRQKLATALRTEMRGVPRDVERAATRVETDAERKAAARLAAGEREAGKVTSAAEAQAAKVVGEKETEIGASARAVERQARKIEEEAKKQAGVATKAAEAEATTLTAEAKAARQAGAERAKTLLSTTTPAERVRDILLGKDAAEWKAMADAIKDSPGATNDLARAMSQVIADRAEQSLPGAIRDWKYISQKLVDNQLMSEKEVIRIGKQLEEIFVAPADVKTRMTIMQRLIRNALTGYVAPGAERAVDAGVSKVRSLAKE